MSRTEPATLDNHGAVWTSAGDFKMVPTALRYEQYEINFAAKVWIIRHHNHTKSWLKGAEDALANEGPVIRQ